MAESIICLSVISRDRPGLLRDLTALVAAHGGNIEGVHLFNGADATETHLDIADCRDVEGLREEVAQVAGIQQVLIHEAVGAVFGKRVIVIGGGAQVAQVVAGAVSEADRHNIRGERISVDTIPLVGERKLADAVRAVGRLPRAAILVLAGSIMGGEISLAVRELRERTGIPVISLNMVGSVVREANLVITDPVQAGVMAVMAIAETASFDLSRMHGRKL